MIPTGLLTLLHYVSLCAAIVVLGILMRQFASSWNARRDIDSSD